MPSQVFRAALFDFDGTLADSYEAISASVNHVRHQRGLPPLSTEDVRAQVGHGVEYLLTHTIGKENLEENVSLYRAHHPSVLRKGTRLLPHAEEVLQKLHERGLQLGICSNKPVAFTRELLSFLEIDPLFDAVLGPEDVARPKPAPDMLIAALERLKVEADEALYIGDMGVDITTARQAGVRVWVVPTGSDSLEALTQAQPDRLLKNLGEILELL